MNVRRVLGVVVLIAFVWAINHYWGLSTLWAPWHRVPVLLVLVVAVAQLASYSIRAYRVYRAESEIPRGRWADCLRLILLNNVTNLLLPARTGEASFPLLLSRWFGVNAAKGSGTLLWLRLLDLSVLAVLALAVLGASLLPGVSTAVIAVLCVAGALAPLAMVPIHLRAGRIVAGRDGRVSRLAVKVLSGVPDRVAQVLSDLFLTWSAWTVKLAALAVVFAALADLPLPTALLGAIGGDLSTVLPIHAPGGFGTYEAGVIALVSATHSPSRELVAAAVNMHLLVLGIALLAGGVAWLTQPERLAPEGHPPERIPRGGTAVDDVPTDNTTPGSDVVPAPSVAVSHTVPSLSVVIPMFREQDNVEPMLRTVHEGLAGYRGEWELIVVDDGSTDRTGPMLIAEGKKYGSHVRILRFRRNHGQTAAMQAGIDASRGAVIATLDGDLQNDPADIPRLVDELLARDLDLLAGKRAKRKDAMISRKIPSKIANALIGKVTGVHITDYGCSLKVYRADVIKQVRLYGEMHRFLPVWAAMVTSPSRIDETPVNHSARQFGSSKYGISRTFRVILDLLTVFFFMRFQARPGHFFGSIGLVIGAIASVLVSYLAVIKFGFGHPIGDRPLFLVTILLLIFAMQFITTGIVAEMLTRILYQQQTRSFIDEPVAMEDHAGWMVLTDSVSAWD